LNRIVKGALAVLLSVSLTACGTSGEESSLVLQEQSVSQLQQLETTISASVTTTTAETTTERITQTEPAALTTEQTSTVSTIVTTQATTTTALSTELPAAVSLDVRAIWIPATDLGNMLSGCDEAAFRKRVKSHLRQYQSLGINTIFLHVRSNGDSYYQSALFPRGAYWSANQAFDPLTVFLEESHTLGLSLHAWVNPLRCQTADQMTQIQGDYQTKQWVTAKDDRMVQVGSRWYMNPAYPEVRALVCAGVSEILAGYDVDGIHIDDYFYPTTAESFDAAAFKHAGAKNRAVWRTENINQLVCAMYDTVKSCDRTRIFSVSPTGSIADNEQEQYADVRLWCSESGYLDWIIPQLYFGFFHETYPFAETAEEWRGIVTNDEISLMLGIATYKVGEYDDFAGAGAKEWTTDTLIPARQILFADEMEGVEGVVLFSSATTRSLSDREQNAIRHALGS